MMNMADLPDDVAALKAIVIAVHARNARLELLVAAFRQAMFGRKSERLDPDQFELALEDIETGIATIKADEEACKLAPKPAVSSPRAANRGSLPKHLPRIDEVIEPDTQVCGCGGGLHQIGEDVSERLDVIPAQFRVIVTLRQMQGNRVWVWVVAFRFFDIGFRYRTRLGGPFVPNMLSYFTQTR